jgi:hypothetical protein
LYEKEEIFADFVKTDVHFQGDKRDKNLSFGKRSKHGNVIVKRRNGRALS